MKKYIYKKSDAFTSGLSLGNPAACIYTGRDKLSEEAMLNIAKQHKGFVSEVVYCSNSDNYDCKLTYYSSECEVDFCGHGTIAAMYELLKSDDELRCKKEIAFETNRKGALVLYNEIKEEDAVYIEAPAPVYYEINLTAAEAADALGIDVSLILKQYPISLIDAGLKTLIIPIASLECEISIFPDIKTLEEFCVNKGVDIVLIFSTDASQPEFTSHTRVFAPKFGYLEDPATGSGNSAFGYYMYENKLWDGDCISLEQGGKDRIYNTVKLKMKDGKVLFGGKATIRIDGHYIIY